MTCCTRRSQGDSVEVDKPLGQPCSSREIQAAEVDLGSGVGHGAEATVEQLLAMKAGDFIELELRGRGFRRQDRWACRSSSANTARSNAKYAMKHRSSA